MRFSASVVIDRSIDRVFAYTTDPVTWPCWLTTALQGEWAAQGLVDIGAMLLPVPQGTGTSSTIAWEVTQYEPPRVFACRTICGPTLAIRQLCESVDGATKLTISADGKTAWLGEGRLALERLKGLLADSNDA